MTLLAALVLSGCTGKVPVQPSVSKKEIVRHKPKAVKTRPKERTIHPSSNVRWVQPANKREACRIYVSVDPDNDKTQKRGYALYWDGGCKEGYAHGLGREFEVSPLSRTQQIGSYQHGMAQVYCVQTNSVTGVTIEGECYYEPDKPSHTVQTTLYESAGDLTIKFQYGRVGAKESPALLTFSSPFRDNTVHLKAYPDSAYQIWDFTHNPLEKRDYEFNQLKKGQPNGLGFTSFKDGTLHGGEMVNGILKRNVKLPRSYIDKADSILRAIESAGQKAIVAQRQAQSIKEKYKQKICRDNVSVGFMKHQEYKAICDEETALRKLQKKIEKKVARLEKRKAKKLREARQQWAATPNLQTQQLIDNLLMRY